MNLREQYNRDGYVVVPNIGKADSIWASQEIAKVSKNPRKNKETYVNTLSACAKLTSVNRAFHSASIDKTLKELGLEIRFIHPPVVTIMSDVKILGVYYGTFAHQDWPSVQGSLDMITVWIPFTDATKDNYPLEVIPGSHLGGLRDGKINGSVLEIDANDTDFLPLECKAGDVVFMSGFLIHRTGRGDGFRVAASMRFDNADESTFIERGYPCAQKRVVDRELKWKPTVEQIRSIYE